MEALDWGYRLRVIATTDVIEVALEDAERVFPGRTLRVGDLVNVVIGERG